jgi:hypothetical protein
MNNSNKIVVTPKGIVLLTVRGAGSRQLVAEPIVSNFQASFASGLALSLALQGVSRFVQMVHDVYSSVTPQTSDIVLIGWTETQKQEGHAVLSYMLTTAGYQLDTNSLSFIQPMVPNSGHQIDVYNITSQTQAEVPYSGPADWIHFQPKAPARTASNRVNLVSSGGVNPQGYNPPAMPPAAPNIYGVQQNSFDGQGQHPVQMNPAFTPPAPPMVPAPVAAPVYTPVGHNGAPGFMTTQNGGFPVAPPPSPVMPPAPVTMVPQPSVAPVTFNPAESRITGDPFS